VQSAGSLCRRPEGELSQLSSELESAIIYGALHGKGQYSANLEVFIDFGLDF